MLFKEQNNPKTNYFVDIFLTCVSVSGEAGVGGEGAPCGGGVDHLHDGVGVQAGRGPTRHRAAAGGQARPGTRGPAQSAARKDI